MLATVKKYIADHNLLSATDLHLVAVSGGADSVALLMVMQELGYRVEAVHCNFHLRGDESDRDMDFVSQLCQDRHIPLHVVHFDTMEYAALHKQSIELAARNLRYTYFDNLRRDISAADILVAHHRDDNVETLLMNIVRGTGMRGLGGIRPANGYIKRPLLCVSRQEIEDYLKANNQSFVTDSTNLEDEATRNVFRHHIVPMLEQINPQASHNIAQTAAYMADVCELVEHALPTYISQVCSKGDIVGKDDVGNKDKRKVSLSISVNQLLAMPSPRFLLYEILNDYGFTSDQVLDIFAAVSEDEKTVTYDVRRFLSTDHCAYLIRQNNTKDNNTKDSFANNNTKDSFANNNTTYNNTRDNIYKDVSPYSIVVRKKENRPKEVVIPEAGLYYLGSYRLRVNESSYIAGQEIVKDKSVATLDASKVSFPLTVRPWMHGDRFVPFGMRGSKLVSDYLSDAKIPVWDREQQTVITDATGKIIWLTGLRSDNRFRVSADTNSIITISVENL